MERYQDSTLTPMERAGNLLERMTIREKVGQLNQRLYGFNCYERNGETISIAPEFTTEVQRWEGLGVLYGLYRADPWSKRDFSNGLQGDLSIKAYNMLQRYVIEHSRFGIPMLMSSECPHGHQALEGYLLPVNLAMGATWNTELVGSAFEICSRQMKELGVDLALISMLDVLRDPRWGRSEECYSEDPYLCASFAEAVVSGCQSQGVAVVAKHFCAQGEGTGGINASAASIGERELREIHLPPAEACCKAGVQGIMAAYNEIDGVPCHANQWLIEKVLRREMGFSGIVMADGTAVDRLDVLTGNSVQSGVLALRSGVDVSLWDNGFAGLEEAIVQGDMTEEELDRAVLRVLELKFSRGLFENPYLKESDPKHYSTEEISQSLEIARQSAVLLKNDGILPLENKITSIAIIGPNANNIYNQLGDYSPPLRVGEGVTVLNGLQKLAAESVRVEYTAGCSLCGMDENDIDEAVNLASSCDVAVLVLGGSSSRFTGVEFDINGAAIADGSLQMDCGEGLDCAELTLPGVQTKLAKAVFATGKPVVTILIQGRPYAVEEISASSNALVCAFYPGPMGGQALAELLLGKICPSGCLPVSVPRSAGQLPVYYNHKASFDAMKYYDLPNNPLYPFGFGLSYTTFRVIDVQLRTKVISLQELEKLKVVEVEVKVKNIGDCAGYAVLQLYIKDLQSSTVRRIKELKSFVKVLLQPEEEKSCILNLSYEKLAVWNSNMDFCVEPGGFLLELQESGKKVWQQKLTVIS